MRALPLYEWKEMEDKMKLAVGSDQAGYELKEKVKAYLLEKGHEVEDLGTTDVQ